MIVPRSWLPKTPPGYSVMDARINDAFTASKPPSNRYVMGIFWFRKTAARKRTGRKGSAGRMAAAYAASVK
ncbi:MAG: hypothetical protein OEV08_07500 [Nitrospira sp.]|nr:hypothetical protein [Nitrospira sp.]